MAQGALQPLRALRRLPHLAYRSYATERDSVACVHCKVAIDKLLPDIWVCVFQLMHACDILGDVLCII